MSPLAAAVYAALVKRLALPDPRISYADLARLLHDVSEDFTHLFHRSRELYAALDEIGRECERRRLPPLPALVVRADSRRPGAAYFTGKHGKLRYKGEQVAAWQRDLEAVKAAAKRFATP